MEILGESFQEVLKYIANPELISPGFYAFWQITRIIFIAVSVFFVAMILYLISVSDYMDLRYRERYSELFKSRPYLAVKIDQDWKEVIKQARSDRESERKMAVIEADEMIDGVLSQMGYEGEGLLEKLEGLNREIIPNIEKLKEAHKTRRDVVYDPSKGLSKEEAARIISIYEEAFKDLQIF